MLNESETNSTVIHGISAKYFFVRKWGFYKKNLAEIPCITVEFVSDSFSTYRIFLIAVKISKAVDANWVEQKFV